MTKEYALWLLKQLMIGASVDAKPIIPQYELAQALDLAIKALEQQSTDAKTYLKRRDENYVEYNVEWFLKNWELELEILSDGKIKPTDADCISREAVETFKEELIDKLTYTGYTEEYKNEIIDIINQMPSVYPKRPKGKWIKDNCSICGYGVRPWNNTPYCPNCGAEMEVEE